MKNQKITIPAGYTYLSDYAKDFNWEMPKGILHKGVAGCGGTTLILENDAPYILCSPRVELLNNKYGQMINEGKTNVLFVRGTDKDAGITGTKEADINVFIDSCLSNNVAPKILVTYDSLKKVTETMRANNMFAMFKVCIDEYQQLLSDASFKSEVEMDFLEEVSKFPYITFMSATPIDEEYLNEIEELKYMDVTELDWTDCLVTKVIYKECKRPFDAMLGIIDQYKNGGYELDGKVSNEAVFFVNSVEVIMNVIKQAGLTPDEVNIIVAKNIRNKEAILDLNKNEKEANSFNVKIEDKKYKFEYGKLPMRGEQHKMFTFVTSTAFQGCDFYNENAISFVFADKEKPNTLTDISTELRQIAGRLRNNKNPFRDRLIMFFNTGGYYKPIKEFENEVSDKINYTKYKIDEYNRLPKDDIKNKEFELILRNQLIYKYEDTYIRCKVIRDNSGNIIDKQMLYNKWAELSERFKYKTRFKLYYDEISIKTALNKHFEPIDLGDTNEQLFNKQLDITALPADFEKKMKMYIEFIENGANQMFVNVLERRKPILKEYYERLGADKIKALSYKEADLRRACHKKDNTEGIEAIIHTKFKVGDRYTKPELKNIIQSIYDIRNIEAKAKATDIEDYFEIKTAVITNEKTNKKSKGFELVKAKAVIKRYNKEEYRAFKQYQNAINSDAMFKRLEEETNVICEL